MLAPAAAGARRKPPSGTPRASSVIIGLLSSGATAAFPRVSNLPPPFFARLFSLARYSPFVAGFLSRDFAISRGDFFSEPCFRLSKYTQARTAGCCFFVNLSLSDLMIVGFVVHAGLIYQGMKRFAEIASL